MAYITKKTTRDGIKPIGSNLYGTCSTSSGTAEKTVAMPDFNVLVEGVTIHVYFENGNTADNATLKVGSTSAQPIRYNGQAGGSWEAGGFISFTYYNGSWIQNDITIAGVTYTFSISGHTMTINGSDGSVQTITLPDDNVTYTLSKSGSTVTLTGSDGSTSSVTDADTKYGLQLQNGKLKLVEGGNVSEITLPDDDTTYTLSISGHTVTMTGSDGSTSSVTIPDANTTYSLSKSGNTITLTGSDGTTTSVTDSNTTYSGMTQAQGEAGTSTTNMVISPKVLHDVIEAMDDDTTYSLSISGHTITLTPSSGSAQSVTVPDNNTTYTISKSGSTVTLTGSDGSTQTFTDSDTTYSAGTGLQLSGTTFSVKTGYTTSGNNRKVQADSNGNLYVVQKDDNTTYTAGTGLELDGTEFKAKLGYTTSGNNRKVQADSNGNLYVTQKDDNTTYSAGTGLALSGTTFNHSNSVTAVTSASFVKVKYDAQGHITGTTAVAKADITALGIPGSDTNTTYTLSINGHTLTLTPSSGTAQTVTLPDNNTDTLVTQTNTTGNADYRLLFSENANDTTETKTARKNTGARYNPSTQALKIVGFDSLTSQYKSLNCDVTQAEVKAQDSSLTTSSADTNWFQALVKAICVKYPNRTNTMFRGLIAPNSNKVYEVFIYNTSNVNSSTNLPQYSFGRSLNYGGGYTKYGTDNYVWRFANVDTNTNTTYTAGTGLELSGTQFKAKLGYTTSGDNRAVQADSSGNLYVVQKDNNTWNANSKNVAGYVAAPGAVAYKVWKTDASGNPAWRSEDRLVMTPQTAVETNLASNAYISRTVDINTESGYRAIAIAGWSLNDHRIYPYRVSLDVTNQQLKYGLHNNGSSTIATVQLTVDIVYQNTTGW